MSPTEINIYNILLLSGYVLSAVVFISLFFLSAPYGRHFRSGWGPSIRPLYGWVLMELPAALCVPFIFLMGFGLNASVVWIFVLVWSTHYCHRAFIYPFNLIHAKSAMPLTVVGMGILFNIWNGYLNGRYLAIHAQEYTVDWLYDPRFIGGLVLFICGYYINKSSDRILFSLRKPGETGYKIPEGGMYRYLSCPNYFGEILEWAGWACMVWNPAGLFFFIWTIANLLPRAVTHHKWYKEQFEEYPDERKAVIPFLI